MKVFGVFSPLKTNMKVFGETKVFEGFQRMHPSNQTMLVTKGLAHVYYSVSLDPTYTKHSQHC